MSSGRLGMTCRAGRSAASRFGMGTDDFSEDSVTSSTGAVGF